MADQGEHDRVNQEGRDKALRYYRFLAVFQFLLAVALLTCAGLAVSYSSGDDDGFGPPYFIGGFVAGILVFFGALLSFVIQRKGAHFTESDLVKRELACAMTGSQILAMFTFMGCFMGLVMVGIGGMCGDFTCYYTTNLKENKALAVAILVLLIITVGSVVCTMCIICSYGSYFGVIMRAGRRGHMTVVFNQGATTTTGLNQQMGMFGQPQTVTIGAPNNGAMVSQLQRQNELLQQQIQLQQLQLQQQQQQTGYPPPPEYGFAANTSVYPPSAPPPEYPGKI